LLTRAPVAGYGAVGGQDVIICAIGSLAMDDPVVLRPVIEDDLPWLDRLRNDPAGTGPHEWPGWRDPGAQRRQWAESGLLTDSGGRLMVVCGTEQIGAVSRVEKR
jgi:hypothetical protein